MTAKKNNKKTAKASINNSTLKPKKATIKKVSNKKSNSASKSKKTIKPTVKNNIKKTTKKTKTKSKAKKATKPTVKNNIKKITKRVVSKPKNLDSIAAVPKPSNVTPKFLNVEDKHKRNNYGHKSSDSNVSKKLSEINKRLNDKPRTWHHSKSYEKKKEIKPILISIAIILIIAILVLGAVFIIKNISYNKYVEDGKCLITLSTSPQGKEIKQEIDLPNMDCNTIKDCELALIERKFSYEHINKMDLDCVSKE